VNDLNMAIDIVSSITREDVVEAAKNVFDQKNKFMRILSHPSNG
jgi:hypothetical protein